MKLLRERLMLRTRPWLTKDERLRRPGSERATRNVVKRTKGASSEKKSSSKLSRWSRIGRGMMRRGTLMTINSRLMPILKMRANESTVRQKDWLGSLSKTSRY